MTVVYAKRLNLPQSLILRPSRAFLSHAARQLLRYAAKMEYGVDIENYVEKRTPSGKPYLDGAPFCFNLSHSGDYAVCALSQTAVGVDIEKIVPISLKVIRRFFGLSVLSPVEQMRLWTRYESYGKMAGCGIPYPKGSEKPCFYKEYRAIDRYMITVASEIDSFCDHIILVDDDAFRLMPPTE
ncbi:MAG: hypothetical protein IKC63_02170 [Clostridia bacterium]|nr:hypothetical protein [Clostridia bacterium]